MASIRSSIGGFTSPASSFGSSSSSNMLNHFSGLVNRYPPGLAITGWRANPSPSLHSGPVKSQRSNSKSPQRSTVRLPYSSSARRLPSPPPTKDSYYTSDPFSDAAAFNPTRTIMYDPQPLPSPTQTRTRRGTLSNPSPNTMVTLSSPRTGTATGSTLRPIARPNPISAPMPSEVPVQVASAPDREARAKLVAGILLHRVNVVGKPMRRRPSYGSAKEYVKSGLSTMVSCEC